MKQIFTYGLVVSPTPYKDGYMFAEITPSGAKGFRRLLPRVGSWWFEVHTDKETWAYEPGGSGGAYTLRECVFKAMEAVQELSEREDS